MLVSSGTAGSEQVTRIREPAVSEPDAVGEPQRAHQGEQLVVTVRSSTGNLQK